MQNPVLWDESQGTIEKTYPDWIIRRINDFFDVTKERVEDILFLNEQEEKQLSGAKNVSEELSDAILWGMKIVRNNLLEAYERIFGELCDGFCEDAKKYEDSYDIIFSHSEEKRKELKEIIRRARLSVWYLGILSVQ